MQRMLAAMGFKLRILPIASAAAIHWMSYTRASNGILSTSMYNKHMNILGQPRQIGYLIYSLCHCLLFIVAINRCVRTSFECVCLKNNCKFENALIMLKLVMVRYHSMALAID